jgi:hypothetical protein
MHTRETEPHWVECNAGFLARKLDDVPYANALRRVDEPALRLEHRGLRRRNHQRAIDTVQRSAKRIGPQHVADHDLDAWQPCEFLCLASAPHQSPDGNVIASELADNSRSARTCRTGNKSYSLFRHPLPPLFSGASRMFAPPRHPRRSPSDPEQGRLFRLPRTQIAADP